MINFKTFPERLIALKDSKKGITYVEGQDQERFVSYGELYKRSLGILWYFQNKGIQPQDELIISLNQNEQILDAFWGSIMGGIVPVPLSIGISNEHRAKIFRVFQKLENPYLYTDSKNLERLKQYAAQHGLEDVFSEMHARTTIIEQIEGFENQGKIHDVQPEDTAFIQFSSGSTGSPKGVVISHENAIHNIKGMENCAEVHTDDTFLSWMPLTHDMGLIGFHLSPLMYDAQQYLLPTELFIRRPLLWLQKASEVKATVTCSPNFGYKHYLKAYQADKVAGLDLSSIKLILNGAEPISVAVCQEFLTTMAAYQLKPESMFTVYGLAEASLAVTFPKPATPLQALTIERDHINFGDRITVATEAEKGLDLISVGQPITFSKVSIRNHDGQELEEGRIGLIYINGENVTKGYYQEPEINATIIDEDGWLNTEDLGFIHDGQLYITGREKEMLIVNGQNYYPHDIEQVILDLGSFELGKVVAAGSRRTNDITDQLIIFIVHKGKADAFVDTVKQVKAHLAKELSLEATEVVPVKRIPKTTSGKVQRHALIDSLEQGEFVDILTELHQLLGIGIHGEEANGADASVEDKLLSICHEAIEEVKIGMDDNIFEVGTNSLTLAQIHEQIEELYPDMVEVTDFFDYPTIRELAAYLEQKLSGAQPA